MIINDNGRLYDSDEMLVIANKDKADRSSYERDMNQMFSRVAYLRYVRIRTIVSENKCQKLSPEQVEQKLNVNEIEQRTSYSKKEILFYINYAKKYIRIIQ